MEKELLLLETELNTNNENYLRYQSLKQDIEDLKRIKTEGIMLRSKAKWIEYGEKNSKYFFNLEKRNYNIKYIKKLITSDGNEITTPDGILQEEVSFYSKLYASNVNNHHNTKDNPFLKSSKMTQLSEQDKEYCESKLTLIDLTKALQSMANNKSPGLDGFTANFYKYFWSELKNPLFESYLYSFENGQLSDGQRRGLLNLIPKPLKDLRLLNSWRPVSLLSTDYKILAKALSLKLQSVIPALISHDQVGYIKGRNIRENIRTIEDIISYTSLNKIPGFITLVDFQKAFDTVEWNFLFDTLKVFNFGENFIKWIKLLYNNILSCVSNNGYLSNYFTLSRGIRQGCPISAFLFILVAEILAVNLRADATIEGIKISGQEFKISQLADDTTMFLKDKKSIEIALALFNKFGTYSGLKLNLDKTEIIPIGVSPKGNINFSDDLKYIDINKKAFKTLGVWFSGDSHVSMNLNYKARIEKVEKLLFIWKARCLSLKGKITILKTLIVPQFVHLFSTIYTPANILKTIDTLFFNFLWNNKPPKIKKSVITNSLTEGGLKMPDINTIHCVQKCLWIKYLTEPGQKKWKVLSYQLLGLKPELLDFKPPEAYLNVAKTSFYQQVLDCWSLIKIREPTSVDEILNEHILYNRYIKIDNKCLDSSRLLQSEGHHQMIKLLDIVNSEGKILDFEALVKKIPFRLTTLEYYGLSKAIPNHWLRLIKSKNILEHQNSTKSNHITLTVNKRMKPLSLIQSREIYWELMSRKVEQPSSLHVWLDLFPFLESSNWDEIFERNFLITKEPALQSFQYKVINRIINCRYNLFKWKIIDSPLCTYCSTVDTIEHHLFSCDTTQKFWHDVKKWTGKKLNVTFNFTICEILFGIPFQGDINLYIINYLIIQGKNI